MAALTEATGSNGPLHGLRIIDLTVAWAGPMATRILAVMGAEVIRVENPRRLDPWRGSYSGADPTRFPNQEPGERPYDRNAWFNTQNHDKRSISLDLAEPAGRSILLRLVSVSDAVVANFSPRALRSLGLSTEDFRAANPDIIVVEMPALGLAGPDADHVGMGQTMEAASGMTSLIGYGDGRPTATGPSYMDPIGGFHGAAGFLLGVLARARGSGGQCIEVAQVEAALHWIGAELAECSERGSQTQPHGNRSRWTAPHDCYPCFGEDEWVAVAVLSDADWARLCQAIGEPALADDERFASVEARLSNVEVIDSILEQWTSRYTKFEAADRLQAAGVPSAPVVRGNEFARDPHLWAAGFYTLLDHAACGTHPYPGIALAMENHAIRMRSAAPRFGEGNRTLLKDLLGCDDLEIAELYAQGAVRDTPDPTA